jgi:uncharacterized lipoprotein
MKAKLAKSLMVVILGCISVVLLNGCQSKIEFKQTKKGDNFKSLTSIDSISYYKLRFNPKVNGTIVITLVSGSEYVAENLNASQISSLLTLLQSNNVQFDTENEEFILKGGRYE